VIGLCSGQASLCKILSADASSDRRESPQRFGYMVWDRDWGKRKGSLFDEDGEQIAR
jgi:hypothetical protein